MAVLWAIHRPPPSSVALHVLLGRRGGREPSRARRVRRERPPRWARARPHALARRRALLRLMARRTASLPRPRPLSGIGRVPRAASAASAAPRRLVEKVVARSESDARWTRDSRPAAKAVASTLGPGSPWRCVRDCGLLDA